MSLLLPLPIFLIMLLIIQRFESKETAKLSNDDKVKLLDQNTRLVQLMMTPMVIGLALYCGVLLFDPSTIIINIGLIVFVLVIGVNSIYAQRNITKNLTEAQLPRDYIQYRRKSGLIMNIIMLAFLTWIIVSNLWLTNS